MDNLIAVIVEGAAEEAILEVLLENDKLKFTRDDLLQEEIIRTRSGKNFAKKYLNKALPKKVVIYRVLDSIKEKFKLPKAYQKQVADIQNYYTQPEIEILFIIYHNDYDKYVKNKKSQLKPSEYAKKYNDLSNLKSRIENYNFWNAHVDELVETIKIHKQYHKKELTIADLLK